MKQIKILGVLAIALTLGLAACNGGGASSGGKSSGNASSKHEHTFDTTKWEADDNYHWHPATCEHTNQKGDRAAHDFGDPYDVVAATCENAGSQKVKCKVCNKEVVQTIDALGHNWVDDEAGNVPATCTEPGSKNQTCSRCGQKQEGVVIEALGHDYGEWVDVEGKAATCETAGEQQRVCSRCGDVDTQAVPALGHKYELVGDDTEPEPGKAKVRVYTCANGCGKTSLGFKASEVSEASKSHLVIGDDGGARFWGRPIGNDVVLNDAGDPDENSHDAVFNDQQTGDFFEYVFDLTADQVATLGESTLLYCDATPAQWMRNNGMDFFACKPGDTDWTRGMYIDDIPETEENEKGQEIDDYRYILYVDDQPKAFDDSITNPVTSDSRGEYILPFVFHLHTGENKISLRMAGGYRSTFYNFTFRPYVAPAAEPAA